MKSDEKLRILKLLEEGKINAEEAYRLLSATETSPEKRNFVIRVETEEEKVNLKIPLNLVKVLTKAGGSLVKFVPENAMGTLKEQNIDIEALLKELTDAIPDEPITLVEINTEEGEHVFVGIE